MKKIFSFVVLSFLMTILFFSLQALAETIEIPTSADTYVDGAQPSSNYGESEKLYASYTNDFQGIWQDVLFGFDLGDLPENIIVNNAYLKVWAYSDSYDSLDQNGSFVFVKSHAILDKWDENVTFEDSPDYYGTIESELYVKEDRWYLSNVTDLVQEWLSGDIENNGIYLEVPNVQNDKAVFFSRESSKKPSLIVDYSIDVQPPETIINSGPSGTIANNQTIFTFSGNDNLTPANSLTFSYRVDNGNWSAFAGYTKLTVTNIPPGAHTFEVRARDSAGNVDNSPASRTFSYSAPAPRSPSPGPAVVIDNIGPKTFAKSSGARTISKRKAPRYLKLYRHYRKKRLKTRNRTLRNRYKRAASKYLKYYRVAKKGVATAKVKFMAKDAPFNGKSNLLAKIRKRIKSKSRAKKQARYKKLYLKNRNLYRKTRNRTLKRRYKKRAGKYKKAYRKVKVVYYKTVKTVRAGWKNSGSWKTYKYTGKKGIYKFYVYATDTVGNKQQNIAKGSFRIK